MRQLHQIEFEPRNGSPETQREDAMGHFGTGDVGVVVLGRAVWNVGNLEIQQDGDGEDGVYRTCSVITVVDSPLSLFFDYFLRLIFTRFLYDNFCFLFGQNLHSRNEW